MGKEWEMVSHQTTDHFYVSFLNFERCKHMEMRYGVYSDIEDVFTILRNDPIDIPSVSMYLSWISNGAFLDWNELK